MDKWHIPKGSMCMTCVHKHRRCDHLLFNKMRPDTEHEDGVIEVICTDYKREKKEAKDGS